MVSLMLDGFKVYFHIYVDFVIILVHRITSLTAIESVDYCLVLFVEFLVRFMNVSIWNVLNICVSYHYITCVMHLSQRQRPTFGYVVYITVAVAQ